MFRIPVVSWLIEHIRWAISEWKYQRWLRRYE